MAFIGKHTIAGKIITHTPLGLIPGISALVKGSWVDNVVKKLFGTGTTSSQQEQLDLEDEYLDENREQDYEVRKRAWIEMDSPEAQLTSQAAAYDKLGINRMMMAGNAVSGASNATSSGSPSMQDSQLGIFDVLQPIMSSIMKKSELDLTKAIENRRLDIDEFKAATERLKVTSENSKRDEEISGLKIQNKNLQELLDLQKGESRVKIQKIAEECKTEPVRRALLRAEVGVQEAREGLIRNQSLWQAAQNKYGDRYWSAIVRGAELQNQLLTTHNKFEETLLLQQLALNTSQLSLMALDKQLNQKNLDYFDSNVKWDRTLRSIQAGAQGLQAIGSTVIGFTGLGMAGKAAGQFAGWLKQPGYQAPYRQFNGYSAPPGSSGFAPRGY